MPEIAHYGFIDVVCTLAAVIAVIAVRLTRLTDVTDDFVNAACFEVG